MNSIAGGIRDWSGIVSLTLLCTTIAFAPMPFGSVGAPATTLWVVLLGLSGMLASVQRISAIRSIVLLSLWTFCICWMAVALLQVCPSIETAWLDNPVWAEASSLLSTDLKPIPSALRFQPILSLGPFLLATITLSCAIVLGAEVRYAQLIAAVLALSGVLYAIFGICSHLVEPTKILGYDKEQYFADLTATFYNRNTAAIYFGSCTIVWGTLLAEKIRRRGLTRLSLRTWFSGGPAELFLPSALFICLVAMFMTRSRAGSLASILGLLVALGGVFYRSFLSKRSLMLASITAIVCAGVLIQFLGSGVAERVSMQGVSDQGRWQAYLSTWHIIQSSPWLGTGLGSFAWVFPAYRSPLITSWGVWDRAHNTFLEIASEGGLPLAGLLACGWIMMAGVLVHGIMRRRRNAWLPAAAFGVMVAVTLHTMVDFPLQIPGFSISFYALLGAGITQSLRSPVASSGRGASALRDSKGRRGSPRS